MRTADPMRNEAGAEIRTEAPVGRILTREGRAVGVVLETGMIAHDQQGKYSQRREQSQIRGGGITGEQWAV